MSQRNRLLVLLLAVFLVVGVAGCKKPPVETEPEPAPAPPPAVAPKMTIVRIPN